MNTTFTAIIYGIFIVSTAIFFWKSGYSLFSSLVVGVFSPLAFLILYTVLLFPIIFLLGHLGVSEEVLPSDVLAGTIAVVITVAWCIGGIYLVWRNKGEGDGEIQPDHSSHAQYG